jgi:hypothetical protein
MTTTTAILTAADLALTIGFLFAQAVLVGLAIGWAWRAIGRASGRN